MIQTNYLNLDVDMAESKGAIHTAREINAQPELWQAVLDQMTMTQDEIKAFLQPLLEKKDLRIILTGAGSSSFIGEAAHGLVQEKTGRCTQAIASTDLVTHPHLYFIRSSPTLLVSFARSGNSPESVEVLHLADLHCDRIYHLIITCNPEGQMMQYDQQENAMTVLLPEGTNDNSLAMTASFTCMLLTVLLLVDIDNLEQMQPALGSAIDLAERILEEELDVFQQIAATHFERAIFLGSGPMLGIARECLLKLQELTDGRVICKHDSFLGFRHGPRVVINEKSIVVFLFSRDPHVFRYELDLAKSITEEERNIRTISFGGGTHTLPTLLDIQLQSEAGHFDLLVGALIGQLLGFYKSLDFGLKPDNPSVRGTISRVVKGVTIYKK